MVPRSLRAAAAMASLCGALAGTEAAAEGGERLAIAFPVGWVSLGVSWLGGLESERYVPTGQSLEAWSEMITVEVFHGVPAPAEAYRERVAMLLEENCARWAQGAASARPEGPYSALRFYSACEYADRRHAAELAWYKVIRGRDNLYVVQRARQRPAGGGRAEGAEGAARAAYQDWAGFFDRVYLCDDRSPETACRPLR